MADGGGGSGRGRGRGRGRGVGGGRSSGGGSGSVSVSGRGRGRGRGRPRKISIAPACATDDANSEDHESTPSRHPEHHRQNELTQLISLLSSAASAAHSFLSHHDLNLLPSQVLALESHLSSTARALSTLLSLLHHPPKLIAPPLPSPPSSWFQRFLSAASADYDRRWLDAFRMSKQSFVLLLRILTPSLQHSLPSIPPNCALAAAIFRLAHAASYKSVGRRFGLDSGGACRAFFVVCKVVNDKLGHMFEFRSDIGRIVVGFGWISLPNCCGVLGLCRFPVEGELLGKDGGLMVQALVDSEGRFLDVSAGWPSTMKPEAILRQTKLFLGVEETRDLLDGPSFELSDGSSVSQYILGDSCFPLLPWLLTPFTRSGERGSLSSSERAFNSVHSRGMGLVATAFGRLRARWQLLSKRWKEECLDFFPFVIVTGCLLHNFLIKCSEPLPYEFLGQLKEQNLPVFEGEVNESGRRIRDALALHLSREFG
ncbi:protein ANTAGONIST OF LIKE HETEROCHROMATIN PROTEIN 1 isoform X2 [Malania oleifera]|uniref:protein ANTAGONIST OF LIKE HETEROCHROMATIN PROTEIN 1 isoform X2 n=1 Tax=Malania oleifera TaxID=397392 RepID=UPI0025AEC5CB|nr:protein ANTAGONIST OF LIKE HETEROCHROMATIN PROTEIN 1 isoform X2 [Malania oleifera]